MQSTTVQLGYELLIHYRGGGVEPVELIGADEHGARVEAEELYWRSPHAEGIEWSPLDGSAYPSGSIGMVAGAEVA